MRKMGIEALYQRPRTTKPHPGQKVFPYLLRHRKITEPNQTWAMDITYSASDEHGRYRPGGTIATRPGLVAVQQHDGRFLH
jgi:transposase InsO family protein